MGMRRSLAHLKGVLAFGSLGSTKLLRIFLTAIKGSFCSMLIYIMWCFFMAKDLISEERFLDTKAKSSKENWGWNRIFRNSFNKTLIEITVSLAFSVSGPDSRCVVTCHGHVTGWPTLLTLSGRAQSCRFPTSAGPDSCAAFFSSTASVSCAGCLVLVVFPALIFSLELQNVWPSSQPDDWHMALCFHVCFLTVAWPCLCLCFPTGIHIPSLLAKCVPLWNQPPL